MIVPFTIVIDTREQLPFDFAGLRADARDQRQPLEVRCERRTLPSGDYSLAGHESKIAIERKSLEDLYHSLGRERRRFRREIERLAAMRFAAVVIEADWRAILESPPPLSKLSPKVVFRTILAWQLACPSVHWCPCSNRRMAEITTFRLLERYWKYHDTDRDLIKRGCVVLTENDYLRKVIESLSARVAAQSELLTKAAERSAVS